MPEVAFVISDRQHYPLRELASTLQYELELQGVPSSLHLGRFPDYKPDRVFVLLDPFEYVRIEGEQALPDDAILRRTIFLFGQAGLAVATGDRIVDLLRRAGVVFAIDQRTVVAMHRIGIPARLLRPGYSRSLDRFTADAERSIDVMFMGRHSPRRAMYLARAAGVLSRRNCLLQMSEDMPTPGDTTSYLAAGRWPLLEQTKVVIHLHHGDDDRFDWPAALDAIHAGAVVVSEHSSGIAPLVVGEHLLVASPDSLPFVADALLRDPERLASLRTSAHERLSGWIPFALPVSVLRAAVVELVGEPVGPGASMGTLHPPVADRLPPDAPSHELRSVRRELGGVKLDLLELRRRLSRLQETLGSAEGIPPVDVRYESPARRAHRAAPCTVLLALRGPREPIRFTLDALLHSRERDFELIVVDAGADGRVLRSTEDWLRAHPRLATMLIKPAPGRGLADARNTGLDFAKSRFCLILDPGQAVTPLCLDALVGTLSAMPDTAFVYPIQEVTGAVEPFVEAGGDYLISYLGWDPQRLRRGNYIHAPALIRVDALRALGGFAPDERLEGLEDYDLWCRLAEHGHRGQLVPRELVRRVENGSGASLVSMRPTPGPGTEALMERAPKLMSDAFPRV